MRHHVTIPILAIFSAALVLTVWPKPAPREPIYKGRALSDWLKTIPLDNGTMPKETEEALQTIGTDGIDFYLRCMKYQPGCVERTRWAFSLKTGGSIQSNPLAMSPKIQRAWEAYLAILMLGDRSQCAIPKLVEFIINSPPPSSSGPVLPSNPWFAISILSGIGRPAVPAMCSLMTNTHLRPDLRKVAISQIGVPPPDTNTIALLNNLLTDPDPKLRETASNTLHTLSCPCSRGGPTTDDNAQN